MSKFEVGELVIYVGLNDFFNSGLGNGDVIKILSINNGRGGISAYYMRQGIDVYEVSSGYFCTAELLRKIPPNDNNNKKDTEKPYSDPWVENFKRQLQHESKQKQRDKLHESPGSNPAID